MEISDQTTCLDRYFASFEESLSSRNYKPETPTNYRYLLRRFGRLLEAERIAPSELTPDLAVALVEVSRPQRHTCRGRCRGGDTRAEGPARWGD